MRNWRDISRVYGEMSQSLRSQVADSIVEMVAEMLEAAVTLWEANGWHRASEHETDCTVQLFRWIEDVLNNAPEFNILTVQLESVQLTPAMRRGTVSAVTMSRPDLEVYLGGVSLLIECKRLSLGQSRPRKYVYKGMARFVSGEYAWSRTWAAMVGYVQADEPAKIVSAVNGHVDNHPSMGKSHNLQPIGPRATIKLRFRSEHERDALPTIAIVHYLVDLRLDATKKTPAMA